MASELYTVENGKLKFHLHPGQAKAWRSTRRFVFVVAGTQSGKTSYGPIWLWREIQNTARSGELNDYIAATASYDLFKLKMLPALRELFEHTLKTARYWTGDRILELQDPSTGKFWAKRADDNMWGRIVLRSASSGGGLESLTAKAAWLDECGQDNFTLESWEAVLRRLSLSRGRVLASTTPYNLGWIKQQVYDRWVNGDTDFQVIQFPSYFNPNFSKAEYNRAKATMPLHRFLMFYDGMFAKPAGLIYDCFDDDIHKIPRFAIPAHWPRYIGVDFGAVNTAVLTVAEDQERGRYIIYRESLEGGKSTQEHVDTHIAASKGENVVLWIGGAPSETQQRMDWAAAGANIIQPYIADVEGGIDRPYSLFKQNRLFVFDDLKGLQDELGTYRRKLDPSGQALEEIDNKRHFHRLDAMRYVCSTFMDGVTREGRSIWG